ncbi:MAG TPA: DUF1493 family protein [Acetobacteraceae bacterium]|nr:DUF1493 family protein [Acetobacteraceae bacterium]
MRNARLYYRENNLISLARYDILHIGESQDEMMVSANLVERIRAICCVKGVIDAHTELWGDLGLHGDDAFELLEAIHTDCGVDFSDLDFNRFFPNETEGIYYWWGRRIGL